MTTNNWIIAKDCALRASIVTVLILESMAENKWQLMAYYVMDDKEENLSLKTYDTKDEGREGLAMVARKLEGGEGVRLIE